MCRHWTERAPYWRQAASVIADVGERHSEAMIDAVGPRPGMQVLDLACGTGEPALPLARALGPTGHVTATDVVPQMVAACEEEARRQGATNVTCRPADAQRLPFPDHCFDAVTCRLGVMYFPDAPEALREILRVLKPGGKAVFTVPSLPGPDSWISRIQAPLAKYSPHLLTPKPEPEPGEPHEHKYAEPGTLSAELQAVGFREVREETRTVIQCFPGTPEQFWQGFREFVGPDLEQIFETLSPEEAGALTAQITAIVRLYDDGRSVNLPGVFIMASGTH
jgi:ubiquinone/menaquinone biosynthesis C-methylase UbiE